MTGRCETCKWWGDPEPFFWGERRACLLATCPDDGSRQHPDSKAVVGAREGGELMTTPDFGCVQWEAKGE